MAYKILKEIYSQAKEIYSQAKEKISYLENYSSKKKGDYLFPEEEMTNARIAVLMRKHVEDLPEEYKSKKTSTLEEKVK